MVGQSVAALPPPQTFESYQIVRFHGDKCHCTGRSDDPPCFQAFEPLQIREHKGGGGAMRSQCSESQISASKQGRCSLCIMAGYRGHHMQHLRLVFLEGPKDRTGMNDIHHCYYHLALCFPGNIMNQLFASDFRAPTLWPLSQWH